jgi:hypothetical protein
VEHEEAPPEIQTECLRVVGSVLLLSDAVTEFSGAGHGENRACSSFARGRPPETQDSPQVLGRHEKLRLHRFVSGRPGRGEVLVWEDIDTQFPSVQVRAHPQSAQVLPGIRRIETHYGDQGRRARVAEVTERSSQAGSLEAAHDRRRRS